MPTEERYALVAKAFKVPSEYFFFVKYIRKMLGNIFARSVIYPWRKSDFF